MASHPDFVKPFETFDVKTLFDAAYRELYPETDALQEIFQHLPASWMKPVIRAFSQLYKDIQMERLAPLFAEDDARPSGFGPSLKMLLKPYFKAMDIHYQVMMNKWISVYIKPESTKEAATASERSAKTETNPLQVLEELNIPMAALIICLVRRGRIPQPGGKNLAKADEFLEKAGLDPKLKPVCDYLRRNPELEFKLLKKATMNGLLLWHSNNNEPDATSYRTGYSPGSFGVD